MTGAVRLSRLVAGKRAMLRMTVREAADSIGMNHSTLWRMEQGKTSDVTSALAACRWLGVSVEYAMTGKEPAPSCSRCVRTETVLAMVRADLQQLDDAEARW